MSGCWQQHPSRTSQLHTATKMQVNTSSPEWINRPASKYSCYLSFKCFPCHGCFSLCVFLLHQLFRVSFGPLQTAFLSRNISSSSSFFLLCMSLSLSTWLAVICQISPWWPACLNQSELTSFRLICTWGDWFSSLAIIWCSIPYLPKQIKLWSSQSADASEHGVWEEGKVRKSGRAGVNCLTFWSKNTVFTPVSLESGSTLRRSWKVTYWQVSKQILSNRLFYICRFDKIQTTNKSEWSKQLPVLRLYFFWFVFLLCFNFFVVFCFYIICFI